MAYVKPQGMKSQVLAGVLSFFFPGLGNLYVGFYTRGFVQGIVTIFCIVSLANNSLGRGAEPLFGIFLGFWYVFSIIDAVRRAGAYNQYLVGAAKMTEMPEMPKDLTLPSQGSKSWGLGLIIVGSIFFLNTKFDFDMRWMEEWWPMILVGFGVWLYWKARKAEQERAGEE
jgi:hypothetical protein